MTFTPASKANGSAIVTVVAQDNGGIANGGNDTSAALTFVINVTPVNQQPTFTAGTNQFVAAGQGTTTVTNWATNISSGAPNESGQILTFTVTNSNNALFAVQPALSNTGTLTFTPNESITGTATVSVVLKDNGGTANGGIDTSTTYTFTITIGNNVLIGDSYRRDEVFDPTRDLLYISTGAGLIERYDLAHNTMLSPWAVGTSLYGMDITPDGSALYVAEEYTSGTQGFIHKVNLTTGAVTSIAYILNYYEGGAFDVKIGANGIGFVTTGFNGSGWVTLRELNTASDTLTNRNAPIYYEIPQNTSISRSADRSELFFTEPNNSDGPVFTYNVATDTFVSSLSTNTFLGGLSSVSHDGSLFALPISGVTVYNSSLGTVTTLSNVYGGTAFDAIKNKLYVADYHTNQIYVYDTSHGYVQLYSVSIGESLSSSVGEFSNSMLRASEDGQYLFLNTPSGVRLFALTNQGAHFTAVLTVNDFGGTYNGNAFAATVSITDAYGFPASSIEGVAPTLTYYAGSTATGTPLPGAPSAAGTYTVVASFAGSIDYLAAISNSVTFNISTKALMVSGLSASNKKYDGTTSDTITGTGSLVGVVGSDNVTLSGTPTGTFANTGPGNNINVTVSGLSLSGTAAGDYSLTQPTLTANIVADQAPVVTVGNTGNITFVRGSGSAVAIEPNLTVTDADDTNEHSATVTLSAIPDGTSEALAASTTGTSISASYNQVSGVLTLTGNDTLAHYQQVLRSVTYVDNLATTTNTSNRTLSIVVNDGTANSTTQTSTVAFDVAPTVTGAFVSGSTWQPSYMTLLGTIGSDSSTLGYALPSGTNQLAHSSEVTWVNADTISLTFSKPVSATLASLTLLEGGASGNVSFAPTSVTAINATNGMSNTWQWKFSTPLVLGKYDINLSATSVTDAAGAQLDGDWTNSNGLGTGDIATNAPSTFATGSGNGTPGGAFNFVFYVLPGDVTTSGLTSGSTFNQAKIKAFQTATSINYRYDIAGIGTITAAEVNTIKLKVFKNIDGQPAVTIPNTPDASQALPPGALDASGASSSNYTAALDAALADPSTLSSSLVLPIASTTA